MKTKNKGRRNLLWIDDDRPNRFLYETMLLENDGWRVIWAGTATSAAELLSTQPFEAAILDIMLPVDENAAPTSCGLHVLNWLRQKSVVEPPRHDSEAVEEMLRDRQPLDVNVSVPVVVATAFIGAAIRGEFDEGSLNSMICKPFSYEEITELLNNV